MSEHRLEAMLARYPRAAEVQVGSSDLRALLTELRRLREIERLLVAGASAALSTAQSELARLRTALAAAEDKLATYEQRRPAGFVVKSTWGPLPQYSIGPNVWHTVANTLANAHRYPTRDAADADRDAWREKNSAEAANCIRTVPVYVYPKRKAKP
jgi:hypothetical protein